MFQKLLGRNYKWFYLLVYTFKLAYAYRMNIIFAILRFFVPLFVTFIILNLSSKSGTFSQYLLIGSIFYQFYAFSIGPSYDITNHVIRGELTKHLLRPSSYFGVLILNNLGFNSIPLFTRLFVISLLIYLSKVNLTFNSNTFLSILTIPFIILIGFCIEIIIGSLSFFRHDFNKSFNPLYYDLMPFFSGSLISFSLSPYLFPLSFTPMALIAYHPMQIYLGNYNSVQIFYTFFGYIFWSLFLLLFARFIFKKGLKLNDAVGL